MIWSVVLLVTANIFLADTAKPNCCYPDTLDADVIITNHGVRKQRAVDYVQHRYYETLDRHGDDYMVIDFQAQKKYTFKGDTCSISSYTNVKVFEQCPNDDFLVPNFSAPNDPGLALNVSGIGFEDGDITRVLLLRTVDDGVCVPVSSHDVLDDGIETHLYSAVTTAISGGSKRIYSDTSKCA